VAAPCRSRARVGAAPAVRQRGASRASASSRAPLGSASSRTLLGRAHPGRAFASRQRLTGGGARPGNSLPIAGARGAQRRRLRQRGASSVSASSRAPLGSAFGTIHKSFPRDSRIVVSFAFPRAVMVLLWVEGRRAIARSGSHPRKTIPSLNTLADQPQLWAVRTTDSHG